jgi:hypothetical protein
MVALAATPMALVGGLRAAARGAAVGRDYLPSTGAEAGVERAAFLNLDLAAVGIAAPVASALIAGRWRRRRLGLHGPRRRALVLAVLAAGVLTTVAAAFATMAMPVRTARAIVGLGLGGAAGDQRQSHSRRHHLDHQATP